MARQLNFLWKTSHTSITTHSVNKTASTLVQTKRLLQRNRAILW